MAHGGDLMAAYYSQLPPYPSGEEDIFDGEGECDSDDWEPDDGVAGEQAKQRGNELFAAGDYFAAYQYYKVGKRDAALTAVCESNAAQCLLKLHHWPKAEDACRRVGTFPDTFGAHSFGLTTPHTRPVRAGEGSKLTHPTPSARSSCSVSRRRCRSRVALSRHSTPSFRCDVETGPPKYVWNYPVRITALFRHCGVLPQLLLTSAAFPAGPAQPSGVHARHREALCLSPEAAAAAARSGAGLLIPQRAVAPAYARPAGDLGLWR